ncbi:GntR family transcriptional regulator [Pelagimonas varians]|uniref:Transcriptional regulator NanR n=1 Tax=Pelagimonas varians TaxID=696760 RepID=A0A238KNB7_9RHOB|nr:GntR family transcriptional regulator [Pelagimonas varians]PYG28920.1 GntR family transcriptional regulator [Pelagimonas varians]SMX44117.1 transcriptional regulator NanR [Pelagimonas varians]
MTYQNETPHDPVQPTVRDRHAVMHGEIRQRICLLEYPPGMRLSEAALAEEFGTSRTPIRRVLARLEDEGLVQSHHGVGTIVTDSDIAELAQVYRLRIELTELVGRLDPEPPNEKFMLRFDSLVQRSAKVIATGTPHDFTRFDMEVFQVLLELTSNIPLRQTMERLYFQTKRIWLKTAIEAQLDLDEEVRIFHQELEAIQLALRSGDLNAAAHIQRAHISMSFQRLQQQNI